MDDNLFELQFTEKMADLSQIVFMWSTNKAYTDRWIHTRTHADKSKSGLPTRYTQTDGYTQGHTPSIAKVNIAFRPQWK